MIEENLMNDLTPREGEVLDLLTKGVTYPGVAKQLFISETTVKTHVNNIFQKLQVHDRTQAVLYAIDKKREEVEALLKLNMEKPKIYLKDNLSVNEINILNNLSLGHTIPQVSDKTNLSPFEIVNFLNDFFKKLEMI